MEKSLSSPGKKTKLFILIDMAKNHIKIIFKLSGLWAGIFFLEI
jgi:hypothetical protein